MFSSMCMVTHFGTNHALQKVDGLRILYEPQVTGFSILRLVIGASQRQARHTRNVMSSQPETVIVLAARATGFSLVSLSHTAFGSGDDQMSLTCRSCPDAPHLDLLLSRRSKPWPWPQWLFVRGSDF